MPKLKTVKRKSFLFFQLFLLHNETKNHNFAWILGHDSLLINKERTKHHLAMTRIICAIVCLLISLPTMGQKPKKKQDHDFQVTKNLEIFNTLYQNLDKYYVDTLDADKLITLALDAMLGSLDPYTEYYPEEDIEDLKMLTTGKYGGIGSVIRMRNDSSVIISEPYEGMPAAEVGLHSGDVLLKIDNTELKGKSVSDVSDMLRGEPGTTFLLKVRRNGEEQPLEFKITRKSIKTPAIPYYGLLTSNVVSPGVDAQKIGYINLSQFTENCSSDMRKAIISLKDKGAESLIIDLRGNGGGLLNEAVKIVNLFSPKGRTIVEEQPPIDIHRPLIVEHSIGSHYRFMIIANDDEPAPQGAMHTDSANMPYLQCTIHDDRQPKPPDESKSLDVEPKCCYYINHRFYRWDL